MNFLIPTTSYGLNSTSTIFLKGGFGIKWPMKVDMPLNKEKSNQTRKKGIYQK